MLRCPKPDRRASTKTLGCGEETFCGNCENLAGNVSMQRERTAKPLRKSKGSSFVDAVPPKDSLVRIHVWVLEGIQLSFLIQMEQEERVLFLPFLVALEDLFFVLRLFFAVRS